MLLSEEGQKYFKESVQGTMIPVLRGTVVSARPTDHPQVIVVALSNRTTPELTLQLIDQPPRRQSDGRHPASDRPLDAGDEVEFVGVDKKFYQRTFYGQV